MMRIVDPQGVVHIANAQPRRRGDDVFAGVTICDRHWVWASMAKEFPTESLVVMDYAMTPPTCLRCVGDDPR